ncbi:MAG: hypothetical protein QG567_2115 [Campylobacterota bacterium]|nr:hypothetical protein [Campylobacterota bacterium]
MKFLIAFILFTSWLFSSTVTEMKWGKSQTFLNFLDKYQIPRELYYNLDIEAQELAEIIYEGMEYHILVDENGKLRQALIPLTEDMQLSLHKNNNQEYVLELVPVEYIEQKESISFEVENSLSYDLKSITGNSKLAVELMAIFKDSVDFSKDLRKGDKVSVLYKRKVRLGKTWGTPNIDAAFVEANKRRHYAFYDKKAEGYFDEKARPIQGMFLKYPLNFKRISSTFSSNRLHPVLRTYRPHNGIDFSAPTGTKVWSVANGRVIFAGTKSGYGKTVIVQHNNGYRTLYAHLNGYAKGIRRDAYVKQGDALAFVGSTGMSTGPHLHFGLYQKETPLNPSKLKGIRKEGLQGKERKTYLANIAPKIDKLIYYANLQSKGITKVAMVSTGASKNIQ